MDDALIKRMDEIAGKIAIHSMRAYSPLQPKTLFTTSPLTSVNR